MGKQNCWEIKKCGRELGGQLALDLGVCPASLDIRFEGIHGGICAGRACWVVAGTMCGGRVQGTFAQKYQDCGVCDFYLAVREEEGDGFSPTIDLLNIVEERNKALPEEEEEKE